MQEPYDERHRSSHRPRVMRRNPRGLVEALTGEITGQPLSFESNFWMPTEFKYREGHTLWGKHCSSALAIRRSRRPWHVRTLQAREPGYLQ
jgi:hypothetical protein